MAQPVWVKIVHPATGGKATCQESVFVGKGGLRDNGWILEDDLPPKLSTKKRTTKSSDIDDEKEETIDG